ncbi:hypothetical protein KP509_01G050400 [Ceratopteris richardii]|nr:hypothetical protein KP509_01G050400 [Ceratopteris richardii]
MGRRDGLRSTATEASSNLPSTFSNAASLIQTFSSKGLSVRDLVTLSGAHSIGNAHCTFAARRVYNFNGPNGIDPTLNSSYALKLRKMCPQPLLEHSRVPLDPLTPMVFDNKYYEDLLEMNGLFISDAALLTDAGTLAIVTEYARDQSAFFGNFVNSMLKMGRIGVLTGQQGEIRRHCSAFNS